jgi:hypothetical protein
MPAAGMAGQVTYPEADPAARADRSPRLRRRCEPPRGTMRPPSRRAGRAAPAYREGSRSALRVRTDPVRWKFPATLPAAKSRVSTRLPATLIPIWSGMRSAPTQTGSRFYRAPRTYPRQCRRDQEAREPFSYPSTKPGHADGDSIVLTFSLKMSSARRIFPARPGEPPTVAFRWRSLSVWPVMPFLHENVSAADGSDSGANGSLRAASLRYPALLFLPPGGAAAAYAYDLSAVRLAASAAVPARYGRSGHWPALPSRCPTRDARLRRGP